MDKLELNFDDFGEFADGFIEAINAVEDGLSEGRTVGALESGKRREFLGAGLVAFYESVADRFVGSSFRKQVIAFLLQQFREVVSRPRAVVRASSIYAGGKDSELSCAPRLVGVSVDNGRFEIAKEYWHRPKTWGVGYQLECAADQLAYTESLVTDARVRFCDSIRGLRSVVERGAEWVAPPEIVCESLGFQFEKLIIDLLTHGERRARHAPLYEDFFERTDIRLKIPGLRRGSGERLQVTLSASEESAAIKRESMKWGEVVLLSPYTIAEGVLAAHEAVAWDDFPWDAFWAALTRLPASVDELAYDMRSVFVEAIQSADKHPVGAAGNVPAAVVQFIRRWVDEEAMRCHDRLRMRTG